MRNAVAAGMIAMLLVGLRLGPECPPPPGCPPHRSRPLSPRSPPMPTRSCIPDRRSAVCLGTGGRRGRRLLPHRARGAGPHGRQHADRRQLTTVPEVSPTIFEPWRHDTVDPDQRLENTLQSMRRRAVVRVTPAQGGHWVEVAVFKELEDVAQPDHATAGAATFRYDSTLTRVDNPITGEQVTKGWIAQGRDTSLEQQIIADLLSRCGQAGRPVVMRGQSK